MASVFGRILAGELSAAFVYRDELVAAFMDVHPVNPGHVLVVPIQPARLLGELEEDTIGRLFIVGSRIGTALRRSGVRCEGVRFSLADGESAGQEVPHVHLHVIPRFGGDRFRMGASAEAAPEELESVAAQIRAALASVEDSP